MKGGKSKLDADTKTLLRILCQRSDSEASQFLKKQFKVPKFAAKFPFNPAEVKYKTMQQMEEFVFS